MNDKEAGFFKVFEKKDKNGKTYYGWVETGNIWKTIRWSEKKNKWYGMTSILPQQDKDEQGSFNKDEEVPF